MGAASNFNQRQIDNAPSIDRNIYDVAKLSPLVNTSKIGGISIAGSNNRFNSFQIDGMVSNDVFGLASSGTNGGQTGTNPISMDAIEQIQIVASPFDVLFYYLRQFFLNFLYRRQSRFQILRNSL